MLGFSALMYFIASSLESSGLFLTSTFSNARINFSAACSKQSMVLVCRYLPGLSAGIYTGVHSRRGEVGGSGTASVGTIISGIKRGLGGE